MKRWFYAIVCLQLVFLLGQAGKTEVEIRRAPTVTLKVAPVDPRSLFMGNYMALSYDISTIDLLSTPHDPAVGSLGYGDRVYVTLTTSTPTARVKSVSASPPSRGDASPYLVGVVSHLSNIHPRAEMGPDGQLHKSTARPTLSVDYGIEQYFIPETKQEEVNRLAATQRGRNGPTITAEIAVTPGGKGLVRRVLVNGKPLEY